MRANIIRSQHALPDGHIKLMMENGRGIKEGRIRIEGKLESLMERRRKNTKMRTKCTLGKRKRNKEGKRETEGEKKNEWRFVRR